MKGRKRRMNGLQKEIENRHLPELMRLENGDAVTNCVDWKLRREEIKKLFSEYTHPVMNYNKEDYHSKDKRILAGDVAQELNVVVGEIGCPTCGATMKGGFVENKCPFCDQPYFK